MTIRQRNFHPKVLNRRDSIKAVIFDTEIYLADTVLINVNKLFLVSRRIRIVAGLGGVTDFDHSPIAFRFVSVTL